MSKRAFASLPPHWQQWVRDWALKKSQGRFDTFGASDFRGTVRLRFVDGSYALFEHAFHALDEARKELAVFTEHCGYFVFSSEGLEYAYSVWAESPGVAS